MADISFEVKPSFRDVKGKFTSANAQLLADKREMMRGLGRAGVKMLREESPKKSGDFSRGIAFKTTQSGDVINLALTLPQPLGTFITEGTKPHKIAARNANALVFHWAKFGGMVVVPKGGGFGTHERDGTLWIGKGHVDHPGTKANPFNERAYTKFRPIARTELSRISVNWRENATR